ncbi:hypothetical protein B0O99DRAFT_696347 [Bisporella sp. PMI_857]|nr:hypothetical protein B0O99DRAFT_696347 [Bisporella sp. PMI_857]
MHPELRNARFSNSTQVETHCSEVQLQTWFPNLRSGAGIWWIVGMPRTKPKSTAILPAIDFDLFTDRTLAGTQPQDNWSPFLQETGWTAFFQQRPYWKALRTLTYLPKLATHLLIDDDSNTARELESVRFDHQQKAILGLILDSQTRIFERCQNTLASTPVVYRQ